MFRYFDSDANPALDFTSGQALTSVTGGQVVLPGVNDPATIVAVSTNRTTGGGWKTLVSFGGPSDYPSLHWYGDQASFYIDATANVHNLHTTNIGLNLPTIMSATTNNATPKAVGVTFNGLLNRQTFAGAGQDGQFPTGANSNPLVVGAETDAANEALDGMFTEAIVYNRVLTDAVLQRVHAYLAIKYGISLTDNYVSGSGTTIYDKTTHGNNIFGIGRDDCQNLAQKQSKSVNAAAKMTIGLADSISTSNAEHPSVFSQDAAFIIIGDNAGTGTTGHTSGGSCPPPPSTDKFTNLNYKIVETGSVQSIKVKFDASGLGFNPNYPIFMQVASDAAFTNMIGNIPMQWSGSDVITNYNFPANATTYIRFTGNTAVLATLCSGDKTINWYGSDVWNWGVRTKTITQGDQTFTMTVTDAGNNILVPAWYPVSLGNSVYIPRYDNDNTGKVVFKVTMSKPTAQVSFPIYGVDWHWGLDKVKVTGALSGASTNPKLSKSPYSWVNITGNEATGSNWLHAGYSTYGVTYVNFDAPVDEFTVEYTKSTTYPTWKIYNYIAIGALDITCRPVVPEVVTPDNVYLFKQAVAKTNRAQEEFTYKFTIQNNNCGNKIVNLTDNLPATLTWIDSSLVSSTTFGTANAYGNANNLSLTNVLVPPGVSYIYLKAKGTTAGTYPSQATMAISGGGTAASDDPYWVFIELHDAANPTNIVATMSALLQRDGDVVKASDGVSPVYLDSITNGNYYIAIRHRNHLGVMTSTTRSLSATSTLVDFTTLSAAQLWNKANGDGYEVTKAGVRNLLWAGDTDGNRQTVFSGPTNDVDPIFFDVMANVANVNFVPNYILNNQYLASDVNMDGKVIFQSGANEVDTILFMVLSHPLNINYLPSYIIVEQLP